jgi:uncharacterized integral membrane protein
VTSSAPTGGEVQPGQAAPGPPQQQPALRHHVVRRTRVGGLWVASALFAVVLLLLLFFILQNGNKVEISYMGAHGHLPLGVALLLAAVFGVLLVVIPGTGRIAQLRVTARRHRRADNPAAPVDAAQPAATPADATPADATPAGATPAEAGTGASADGAAQA